MAAAAGRSGIGSADPFGPAASSTSSISASEKPVNSIGYANALKGI